MCIFNKPIKEVSQTKILVSPTPDNRVLTVYENTVGVEGTVRTAADKKIEELEKKQAEKNANAMILPAPLHTGNPIKLLDLSTGFTFEDCHACFPKPAPTRMARSRGKKSANDEYLEVFTVGAYNVSIAENLDDLRRIDPSVFKVEPNVDQLLGEHYPKSFGFVICCFDSSKEIKPHPMGYICDVDYEDKSLFVPCRHEHGGGKGDARAHFDHVIYSINTTNSSGKSVEEEIAALPDGIPPSKTVHEVFSDGPLKTHVPEKISCFRRLLIKGMEKNQDYHFKALDA